MDTVDLNILIAEQNIDKKIRDGLRNRFRSKYLSIIIQYRINIFSRKKILNRYKSGDIFLLESKNNRRIQWPSATIIAIYLRIYKVVRLEKAKTEIRVFSARYRDSSL